MAQSIYFLLLSMIKSQIAQNIIGYVLISIYYFSI